MDTARAFFKGKKITVLGLGLLGKGLGDTTFLAECGAEVTVTDLKTAKELAPSVGALKKYKNIRFVLGKHDLKDFEHCDMVLKAQGTPIDSLYIAHARAHNIPIRMDDELFVTLAPKGIKVIGVTGTRGKTTTSSLIAHILKTAGKTVHLGGNIRGVATLALLKKAKAGDYVVLELSSWQLQGFGEQKMSPHVSVFTNFMPDHMNYYNFDLKEYFSDKAHSFKHHRPEDTLVAGEKVSKKVPKSYKGKLVVSQATDIPKSWKLPIPGEHNRENVAFAIGAAKALKVPLAKIREGVESFKAVEGRLELLKTVRGIEIYNDNNSTTPEATIAALKSFPGREIVLIMGGADKGLETKELLKAVYDNANTVILLPGSGSDKIVSEDFYRADSLAEALTAAFKSAEKGDIVLFSPAFASFGQFVNEYDRNDQFIALVKKLK
jgi:UDP-N-acetylmuramoylalanine--D-glutamate ligase